MRQRWACARTPVVVALLVLAPCVVTAQHMPLPVELQFSLFYRIMSYDRNQEQRSLDGLVIAVVYQSGYRASRAAHDEAVRQRPPAEAESSVRFVSVDLDGGGDLAAALADPRFDVLYVAPLRAVGIADIATACRRRRLLCLTGVPEYVESGLAVGVGLRGERPEILVNLAAARAGGADFSAQLLRLARVW